MVTPIVLSQYFEASEIKSFIDEQGMCWFQMSHLAKALGFKNATDAMNYHTDEDERQLIEPLVGVNVWFVSEPGLWGMIFASKKPEAKEFKRWLKHDVLPKLRSQGLYALQQSNESLAEYEARNKALVEY